MAFPIIPKKRSGATGNPPSLQLGELATNTATGELFLGGDGGVMLLNAPSAAGTTVTEHTGDGTKVAFTFTGYSSADDGAYLVSVGGIDQPPSKYSVSSTAGGTITFVEAPVDGELISIRAIVSSGGGGGSGDATSIQGRPVLDQAPDEKMSLTWVDSNWQPSFPQNAYAAFLQETPISTQVPASGDLLKFDGTNWTPFSGLAIPNWVPTIDYMDGDLVCRFGIIFVCIQNMALNQDPFGPASHSYWATQPGVWTGSIFPVDPSTVAGWVKVKIQGGAPNSVGFMPYYV